MKVMFPVDSFLKKVDTVSSFAAARYTYLPSGDISKSFAPSRVFNPETPSL